MTRGWLAVAVLMAACESAPPPAPKKIARREITNTSMRTSRERCYYSGWCDGLEWKWFCRGTRDVELTTTTRKVTFTDGTVEFHQTTASKPLNECM